MEKRIVCKNLLTNTIKYNVILRPRKREGVTYFRNLQKRLTKNINYDKIKNSERDFYAT